MPRIFRTLETRNGRSAFDTIAKAAVADFLEVRQPAPARIADFSHLMTSIWSKLPAATRKQLAIALAPSPHVPRAVVELLLAEPPEISAPFLFSSPCLTGEDAAALASPEDRGTAPDAASPHLADTAAAEATSSRPPAPRRVAPGGGDDTRPPLTSAAAARDALLALARVKPRRAAPQADAPLAAAPVADAPPAEPRAAAPARPASSIADLLQEARSGSPERTIRMIADRLQLSPEIAATLPIGSDGRALATALKLLGLSAADAMTVVLLVHATAGRDVDAFRALRRFYDDVSETACQEALGLEAGASAKLSNVGTRAKHRPLHAEGAGLRPATQGRPAAFGRRRNLPSGLAAGNGRRS
ncbi:hypothetical protein [Aurantimonas sp. 22II-16-19i]|uniref:hypothetical protein n=1 Tax=Aurantimonas sp. 22II-16-19i TaxID=1317114 RepID=UPI00111BEAB6|nr:hypothetical protein [Aurantimonas sp. 22II-16-19i]